jgi:serine/threonine protein kinase
MPRFYDYAPEAKPPYIAMARAPGQPAARLCSPPRLRPAEVAAVGVKLAQVLAVVHARGVLHRDLNASNVLIDGNGAVTLLDFGCAELGEKFYDVPCGRAAVHDAPRGQGVDPGRRHRSVRLVGPRGIARARAGATGATSTRWATCCFA